MGMQGLDCKQDTGWGWLLLQFVSGQIIGISLRD